MAEELGEGVRLGDAVAVHVEDEVGLGLGLRVSVVLGDGVVVQVTVLDAVLVMDSVAEGVGSGPPGDRGLTSHGAKMRVQMLVRVRYVRRRSFARH